DTVAVRTFLPGPPHIRPGADIITHRPIEPGAGPVGDEFQILGIVDVHGNSTQDWRVEATGQWLATISTTVSDPKARWLKVVGTPAYGDTATVYIYDAVGAVVSEALATFTETSYTDMSTDPPGHYVDWAVWIRDKRPYQ